MTRRYMPEHGSSRPHAAVLSQLAGRVAPAATPDAYDDMLRELSAITAAEEERVTAYRAEHHADEAEAEQPVRGTVTPDWERIEVKMAEDRTHWPDAG